MVGNLLEAVRWFVVVTPVLGAIFLALLFVVSLIQVWVPRTGIRDFFRGRRVGLGYVGGAVLGTLTPFCSMTTIPALAGLLRSGVPFGPTMAFLISSPLLDVIVLGVLVFLIGPKLTVIYAGITFLLSIGLARVFAGLGLVADVKPGADGEGGSTTEPAGPVTYRWAGSSASAGPQSPWPRARAAVRKAGRRAWGGFVRLAPHLLVGTAIGAVVRGFLPVSWIVAVAGPEQRLAIPVMAALGLPVYINAEILLPITAALVGKGVGIGAVVALVIAGLGMSASEVALLTAFFRPRLIAALVASFFLMAVAGGLITAILAA